MGWTPFLEGEEENSTVQYSLLRVVVRMYEYKAKAAESFLVSLQARRSVIGVEGVDRQARWNDD